MPRKGNSGGTADVLFALNRKWFRAFLNHRGMEQMEARFDLPNGPEKSDWKAFFHVYFRLNPAVRLLILVLRVACAGASALMAFMTLGILASEDIHGGKAVVPGLLCLLLLCYAAGFRQMVIWQSKRNMLASNGRMVVTINRDGVTDQTGSITTHYGYDAFYAVCYYRDIYMLFLSRKAALVLPERCREGAKSSELKAFLEQMTGKTMRYFK